MKKLIPFFILTTFFAQLSSQSSWSLGYLPFFRDGNGIYMLDNYNIITVGGNETNDVIRDINKSTNGGKTWDNYTDAVNEPWLKGVTFTSSQVGFATGFDGTLLKTVDAGDNWLPIPLTGNFVNRDYNAIVFTDAQTGYLAGGNRSNDSIQTILKTTDGGVNWNPQRDALGFWLKDIFFIDVNNGFAVGERGVVLKTTNAGANWNPITLAGSAAQRTYNAVWFVDANTGIMVGGNRQNDSIQTILRTTDGGNNWSIIRDSVASWLNDVHFYDANNGYAVGDDGTLLKTTDKGLTWTGIVLPASVNDSLALHTVFFTNEHFGIVTGRLGKTLLYRPSDDSLPVMQTAGTVFTGPSTVQLLGSITNNGGQTSQLWFEYGTNLTFGNTVAANPPTAGTATTNLSASISGLTHNMQYYFRIKATSILGTFYSNVDSFYLADFDLSIPNWNFELWDSIVKYEPVHWKYGGTTTKVSSFDGGSAIELSSRQAGNEYFAGAILNAIPGGAGAEAFKGGVPFSARPDSMFVYIKHNMLPGDTGLVLAVFKANGSAMGVNYFTVVGSSGGNFVRYAFPLSYQTLGTPDSVILAFTNTDPSGSHAQPSNPVTVDKISFSNTLQNVVDADFETWILDTIYSAVAWAGDIDHIFDATAPPMLERTTDKWAGSYALTINSLRDGAKVSTYYDLDQFMPTFAIQHKPVRITGYYKLQTIGDTAIFSVNVYQQGVEVGNANVYFSNPAANYTPFALPINYIQNAMPDSAHIRMSTGGSEGLGVSAFTVDALSWDAFVDSTYGQDTTVSIAVAEMLPFLNVYPNPSTGAFTIAIDNAQEQEFTIEVMDVAGKVVQQDKQNFHNSKLQTTIDLSGKPAGIYFICLKGKGWIVTRKVMKSLH